MPLPSITLSGNLTADPVLRITPKGAAVTNFRVASSQRVKDDAGNWADGDTCYLDVTCWRNAEQIAEALRKGTSVAVTGRLKQRQYETKDGETRTVFEVDADEVSLVIKPSKAGFPPAQPAITPTEDIWATSAPF